MIYKNGKSDSGVHSFYRVFTFFLLGKKAPRMPGIKTA
jgi:hypothetical protein